MEFNDWLNEHFDELTDGIPPEKVKQYVKGLQAAWECSKTNHFDITRESPQVINLRSVIREEISVALEGFVQPQLDVLADAIDSSNSITNQRLKDLDDKVDLLKMLLDSTK